MTGESGSRDASGFGSRWAALEALSRWLQGRGFLQESLEQASAGLEPRDRGLAWELAFGVCRRLRRLQAAVQHFSSHRKPDPKIELVLCIGLYQLHFLDRVPKHAAVHLAVEMARKLKGEAAARFVNALLQRSLRDGLPALPIDPVQALALEFSVQDWLVQKWLADALGDLTLVRGRLESGRSLPVQWARVHIGRVSLAELQEREGLQGARTWGERWVEVGDRLGDLLRGPSFREGLCSVQNPASELMLALLGVEPGNRVWDACAAPGGKSALLLERTPGIELWATDIDVKRLASMDDLRVRLRLPEFRCVACDTVNAPWSKPFDRILVDAPCSNLGVMSRRPEVPMRLDRKAFQQVVAGQRKILNGAARHLAVGGVLVYGTCSPEREETGDVVEWFLRKNPGFRLESAESCVEARWVRNGYLVAGDDALGFDGFFGARLRRVT